MPLPSQILAMGNSPGSTTAIVGTGATGLVATGSSITDALQLSNTFNTFTTSSASTGFILPVTEVGAWVVVRNDSGQTLTAYPKAGSTINAGASTVTLATAKTMIFFAMSATTWATNLTA